MHPFGPGMAWQRHGMLAATIVNAAPNRKRGARAARPADFIPKPPPRGGKAAPPGGLDGKRIAAELRGAFAGRIVDKRSFDTSPAGSTQDVSAEASAEGDERDLKG